MIRALRSLPPVSVLASLAMFVSCTDGTTVGPAADTAGHPLLLIGIDGATWDVIDPMIERGELPAFADLAERGVRGRLVAVNPLISPVAWTTIATGRFPREHGILDFTFPYEPGTTKNLVRSTVRRVPAIWNVATDAGLTVGVVGYFATHPAEPVHGIIVSDRAHEGIDGSVSPADQDTRFAQVRTDVNSQESVQALQDRFIHWDYDRRALRRPDDPFRTATRVVAGRIDNRIVIDEFVRRSTLEVMADQPELTMTYFRITDHASHAAWIYHDDSDFESPPKEFDRELLADLIPESYRYVDDAIADFVAHAPDDTNIVILSDHGSGSATGDYPIRRSQRAHLTGNHRYDGILLAAGPDIGTGEHNRMTVVDAAPTLMALLGLPISRELSGRVEEEIFSEAFRAAYEPQHVPTYDFEPSISGAARPTIGSKEQRHEQEALDALAALGYLSDTVASTAASEDAFDFWAIDRRLRRRALLGELVYLLYRGESRRLGALLSEIHARDPLLAEDLPRAVERATGAIESQFGRPMFSALDPDALFVDLQSGGAASGSADSR